MSFATPSMRSQTLEASTSRRPQGTRVGHTNSFRHRITRLERSRSSGSTSGSSDQRDGAGESAHHTRARLRAVAMVGDDRQDRNSQRQRHHARVPPQESPPSRAAGAWRVVVTTSRYVPHSAAPRARRPTVRAVVDREAARRQARRDDARPQGPYRPRVQAASFSGRSGQPRVDSTTHSSLLVNAGLSCVDEEDHGTGRRLEGERERAVSAVTRVIGRMPMDTTRRCLRSSDCWHARPLVRFSTRPSRSRIVLSKRAANESRHLRPVLVREPARRVDR